MAKMLVCPNCGNNHDLSNHQNMIHCYVCGYSWPNIQNKNTRSSAIRVVMDTINHFNYTVSKYSDSDDVFPFYAINNKFIDNNSTPRKKFINTQSHNIDNRPPYVGLNKINSQRTRITYNNRDFIGKRVVSDRTNQEYNIIDTNNSREEHQRDNNSLDYSRDRLSEKRQDRPNFESLPYINEEVPRKIIDPQREESHRKIRERIEKRKLGIKDEIPQSNKVSLKEQIETMALEESARNDPEAFFNEYEVTRINKNGTIDIIKKEFPPSQADSDIVKNIYSDKLQPSEKSFSSESSNERFLEQNDLKKERPRRTKKERLSSEQREYKEKLRTSLEKRTLKSSEEKLDGETPNLNNHFNIATYEELRKEQSDKIRQSLKEKKQKKNLSRNLLKDYSDTPNPQPSKTYSPSLKINKEEYLSKNYKENPFSYDKEVNSKYTERKKVIEETRKKGIDYKEYINSRNYEKKLKKKAPSSEEKKPSPYESSLPSSALNEMIQSADRMTENIEIQNNNNKIPQGNSRLSFFEKLKTSSLIDKNDPLGLNEDYNSFFEKHRDSKSSKSYSLKKIIEEIKKRVNKDKLVFKIVVFIAVFGVLSILSETLTSSEENKAEKNIKKLDTNQDFINMIPTIDDYSKTKGVLGESNTLLLQNHNNIELTEDSNEIIEATSSKENTEILAESKKKVSSLLSLDELKSQQKNLPPNTNQEIKEKVKKSSFLDKTATSLKDTVSNIFSDVSVDIISNSWKESAAEKYYQTTLLISNKSKDTKYTVKAIEIAFLDMSGDIINKRDIYINKALNVKEVSRTTLRIPKAPDLTAKVKISIKELSK